MTYRLKAYVLLIVSALISGFAGPVIKLTLGQLTPEVFLLYRFFIASIAMVVMLPFVKLKIPKKPGVLRDFLIFGFLNVTLSLGFLFWGASKTTLLEMSLLSIFGPIVAIVIAHFALREHITKQEKIGIGTAFIGSFVLIVGPFLATGDHIGQISGNVLIILALVSGSIGSIMVKRLLRQGVDAMTLTHVPFLIGFISFLALIIARGTLTESIIMIRNLSLPYHLGVAYMALLSGTLAYYLGTKAQKSIEVSEAAIFSYIYPIMSAFLAISLLGEKIYPQLIIGAIITFVGVFIAEVKRRKRDKQSLS
jgi:drug/metabolite transporter (DMT)-like permease